MRRKTTRPSFKSNFHDLYIGQKRFNHRRQTTPAKANPMSKTDDRTDILKAIAHPVRMEFLDWMKQPEAHFSDQEHPLDMGVCAGQFEKRCGLSQSTVSAHLSTLEKAGLIRSRRVGQWAFYSRDEDAIGAFVENLRSSL
jgi:DNA-binding transcriptional ArsR family regulator